MNPLGVQRDTATIVTEVVKEIETETETETRSVTESETEIANGLGKKKSATVVEETQRDLGLMDGAISPLISRSLNSLLQNLGQ
jgi:hypothetical protein